MGHSAVTAARIQPILAGETPGENLLIDLTVNLEGLDEVVETVLQDGDIFVTLGAGSIGAWAAEFLARHQSAGKGK